MSHPHGDPADPTPVPAVEFSAPAPVEPTTAGFTTQPSPAAVEFSAPAAPHEAPAPAYEAPVAVTPAAPFEAPAAAYEAPAPAVAVAPAAPVAAPAPVAPMQATSAFQVPAVAQATMPQPVAEAFPVSAPAYAPVSAVPGYPVSAVPGYPVSATPYGYVAAVPAPKKRWGVIVLSIAMGLLGIAAAAMTTLYFVEHGERTSADKVVAEQITEIKTLQDKTKSLESQLSTTKQELTGAKSKTEQVTKEREALANCFRAINAYGMNPNTANRNAADTACIEAAKYY